MNNNRKKIEYIQQQLKGTIKIINGYRKTIEKLAVELYEKDTHFIFELIQNAEDNSYENNIEPSLTFKLLKKDFTNTKNSQGVLVIENNEKGFTYKDVDAICDTSNSTKKKQEGFIGEKGIGFKSVFKVSTLF